MTAVSERTCVVQFKDFNNYEEVLQVDCIPITEDSKHRSDQRQTQDGKKQDYRFNNRSMRHDQNNDRINGKLAKWNVISCNNNNNIAMD